MKSRWRSDSKALALALYGYKGELSLGQGRVRVWLKKPRLSSMPEKVLRRELETALKKICG